MTRHLSILRGINVSGQKKISMLDLKATFEKMGFTKITTYIQSGNVIFESKVKKNLEELIEKQIKADFGFEVPIIIRTKEEIREIITLNPFLQMKNIAAEMLHVTYLSEYPEKKYIQALSNSDYSPDQFQIIGKEVYVYCPNGYGKTKINNTFFEHKLKVKATTRNWKTTNALFNILSLDQDS